MYVVPPSKKSLHQNQFEFTVADSDDPTRVFRIPKAKYLAVGDVDKIASRGQENVKITDILDILGHGEAREAVLKMDVEQMEALMNAWQADSGITLGESSASS